MSNIIEHPVVTAEKVESLWGVAGSELNLGEIHAGLSLDHYAKAGSALASLRDQNPENVKFGVACAEHEIFLTPQVRAAVIWWGRLVNAQRETLVEWFPSSASPKSIQDRCREEKPEWLKFENVVIPSGDNATSALQEPENNPVSPAIEPEPIESEIVNDEIICTYKSHKKAGRTNMQIIIDHFPHLRKNRLETFFKGEATKFASLILSGVFGKINEYGGGGISGFTTRMAYNDYPKSWRYDKLNGKELLKNIDEVIEHYKRCDKNLSRENCQSVLDVMKAEKKPICQPVSIMPSLPAEVSHIVKGSCKPADTQDIVVAGHLVWSESNTKGVEYEDAWAAYQLFKRLIDSVSQPKRQEWARHTMNLGKFMHMIMVESACHTWTQMANAVKENPDKYESETHGAQPATNHA